MYRSTINIKHGCLTHLFWGYSKESNDYIHIRDVSRNGEACKCCCPVCDGIYIACVGEKNRPYFKHKSKYKCMYTDEITNYLRVKKILEAAHTVFLPSLKVAFGSRMFEHEAHIGVVDDVFYYCEEEQYPPLLIATIDSRPTRILLNFGKYYSKMDLNLIKNEVIQNNWDCIVVNLPKIGIDDCVTTSQLGKIVLEPSRNKVWLFSKMEAYWRKHLEDVVTVPKDVFSGARECYVHKRKHENTYYANYGDCDKCQFNLGSGQDCKCAAKIGITRISDFDVAEELRQYKVDKIRGENERIICEQERKAEYTRQKLQLEEEHIKREKQQIAEKRKKDFYQYRKCPHCGKQLKKNPGKKGVNWWCLGGNCGFYAFEDYETGEIIVAQE